MNRGFPMSLIALLTFGLVIGSSYKASGEETKLEKSEAKKNKTVDLVKRKYRNMKDKTCRTVNGEMECVEKEIKHKVQDTLDKVNTKAKEEKNKID